MNLSRETRNSAKEVVMEVEEDQEEVAEDKCQADLRIKEQASSRERKEETEDREEDSVGVEAQEAETLADQW
jgi:hypothetical protein